MFYFTNICYCFNAMRNTLLLKGWAVLAVSCWLASCINDDLEDVPTVKMKKVVLTTCLDGFSRAAQDETEMELFYTVYDAASGAEVQKNTTVMDAVSFGNGSSVNVTLELERDKSYDIAFWAQAKGAQCYDLSDMKAIKLRYEVCRCNDPLRKAYYGSLVGLRVDNCMHTTVLLKSPFAELEVLTTVNDVEAAGTIGIPVNKMDSSLLVSGVASSFNPLSGTACGEALSVQLLPNAIPSTERMIDGEKYRVLVSDYLLPFRQQPVEVKVALSYTDIEKQPLVFTAGRAWLNRGELNQVYGRFLTSPIEFDVNVNDWQNVSQDMEL